MNKQQFLNALEQQDPSLNDINKVIYVRSAVYPSGNPQDWVYFLGFVCSDFKKAKYIECYHFDAKNELVKKYYGCCEKIIVNGEICYVDYPPLD